MMAIHNYPFDSSIALCKQLKETFPAPDRLHCIQRSRMQSSGQERQIDASL